MLKRNIRIKSENIDDALSKASEKYDNQEIVLDYNDFTDICFSNLYSKKLEDSLEIKIKYDSITGNLTIKSGEKPEEIYSVDTVDNLTNCLNLYIADHIEEHDIDSEKGHQISKDLGYIDEKGDYDVSLEEYE